MGYFFRKACAVFARCASRYAAEHSEEGIEAGLVKPTIHAVLPIEEAEAAQDILYRGENVGKVVLTVEHK